MADSEQRRSPFSRRTFLQGSALVLGGLAAGPHPQAAAQRASRILRVGLIADVHYADAPARGSRHYRDSLSKLGEAVDTFNEAVEAFNAAGTDFVAVLGDHIDSDHGTEANIGHLQAVEAVMEGLECPHYPVLGNHCLDGLTKEEFIANSVLEEPHYSFDTVGIRFVVVDCNYREDGEPYAAGNFDWTDTIIPEDQLQWLEAELAGTDGPAIVFSHQPLDDPGSHGVNNHEEVRAVLQDAGNVAAVFQAHNHSGAYQEINGIHYCTQKAMVEGPAPDNNAYALLDIHEDGFMRIQGFGRQDDRAFQSEVWPGLYEPPSEALGTSAPFFQSPVGNTE
ncbi:MAG: metallophosphoesterase [Candidatus Hydrogenedentota bacterium]